MNVGVLYLPASSTHEKFASEEFLLQKVSEGCQQLISAIWNLPAAPSESCLSRLKSCTCHERNLHRHPIWKPSGRNFQNYVEYNPRPNENGRFSTKLLGSGSIGTGKGIGEIKNGMKCRKEFTQRNALLNLWVNLIRCLRVNQNGRRRQGNENLLQ